MRKTDQTSNVTTLRRAPPEASYPGLSPQLLARVRQLWSANGMEFDANWRLAIRAMKGFRAVPRIENAPNSTEVDLVFLFDQCVIWAQSMQAAARMGRETGDAALDLAQWHGLAALMARLTQQLAALRILALTGLPMPAMQIARSVSEDVDMVLALLARRKLAARFVACRDVTEASEFWRRHITGGRAFRAVTEKLYAIGLDYSPDSEYGQWRKRVLSVLGAAVHSNALPGPQARQQGILHNDDSLYFATFRIHELCAYAQLIQPEMTAGLARSAGQTDETTAPEARLAPLAAPMSAVLINQIESLSQPALRATAGPAGGH